MFNSFPLKTFVGKVLIAINPNKQLNSLYTKSTINKYRSPTDDDLPPHIYKIANEAMKRVGTISQSILIMGVSGSGKTESTKHIIRFLCNNGHNQLMDVLTSCSHILEAFGNCVTQRNANSSRYCQVVKVFF